jgi:hypothetical protein
VGVALAPVHLEQVAAEREAGDPPDPSGVQPDDVDGPRAHDPLDARGGPLALAVGDHRLGGRAELRVALGVVGAERLLDPVEVVLLERADPP